MTHVKVFSFDDIKWLHHQLRYTKLSVGKLKWLIQSINSSHEQDCIRQTQSVTYVKRSNLGHLLSTASYDPMFFLRPQSIIPKDICLSPLVSVSYGKPSRLAFHFLWPRVGRYLPNFSFFQYERTGEFDACSRLRDTKSDEGGDLPAGWSVDWGER